MWSGKRRKALWVLNSPLVWIEKQVIEPIADYFNKADLFNILEKFSIIIAVFLFALEFPDRQEKAIFEAWAIVNDAENLPFLPKPTMQGFAICPHCGNSDLSLHKGERYYCKECKKKFAASKVVFK